MADSGAEGLESAVDVQIQLAATRVHTISITSVDTAPGSAPASYQLASYEAAAEHAMYRWPQDEFYEDEYAEGILLIVSALEIPQLPRCVPFLHVLMRAACRVLPSSGTHYSLSTVTEEGSQSVDATGRLLPLAASPSTRAHADFQAESSIRVLPFAFCAMLQAYTPCKLPRNGVATRAVSHREHTEFQRFD